jgi:hypothetical protein
VLVVEDDWQQARLIPVSGINGPDEQERRGASALLAVMSSVREFGRALTTRFGAPAGAIEAFIEVPFMLGDRNVRPDGLIRVRRGSRTWTALIEVKTARVPLAADQVECYLDVARAEGFDAVITISNEIATSPGVHPLSVDKRKLRKVGLHHLSWSEIHTEALIEQVNRLVSDPDQAWILGEFIRYLRYPKSGALDFDDMGPAWVTARDAVATGARPNDKVTSEVVARFEQLVNYAGMSLSRQVGVNVRPALTRKELAEPEARLQLQIGRLIGTGRMQGSLLVPDTISPLVIAADLRSGRVECSVSVEAPGNGRALTRVNWLVRQLHDAPADLQIEAVLARARQNGTRLSLGQVREDPRILVPESALELRAFNLSQSRPAGKKGGQRRGSFVGSVLDLVDAFYRDVVQHLKPWTPPAPQVKASRPSDDLRPMTGELRVAQVAQGGAALAPEADELVGVVAEPDVAGAPELIDKVQPGEDGSAPGLPHF